jgi:D-alanyl-D-alanine carboxypeptidase (penicillin-binding protein 5/6)
MEDLKSGLADWDTMVTVSEQAWRTGGSQMFLNIGQQVSFKDLLKGIAIVSANDACIAVAEYLSGSEAAFVQRMNQRASELGLENSHFTNPHGMDDPDHYMSALDVARLAAYFIRTQPEAAAFQSEKEFTFNEIRQFNRNPLLGSYPGADGIKTGSTPEAGYCLASTSKQQGMRLISVVLNTASEEQRHEDSIALLNHGFRNFEIKTLYEKEEVIAMMPVKRGQKRKVGLVAGGPVQAVVPRDDSSYKITEEFDLPDTVAAPVKEGDIIGTLHLKNPKGELIAEVELAARESLKRLGFLPNLLRQAGDLIAGLWQRIWPW